MVIISHTLQDILSISLYYYSLSPIIVHRISNTAKQTPFFFIPFDYSGIANTNFPVVLRPSKAAAASRYSSKG